MVEIKDRFRKRLFDGLSVYKLNSIFPKHSVSSFKNYKRGAFIPVCLFEELVRLKNIDIEEVNRGILKVKKRLCGLPIKISLPICCSEQLAELVGHTFGDGHISEGGRFVYVNTSGRLIEKVRRLVCYVFGDSIWCNYRKRSDGSFSLHYPSAIGELLAGLGCIKGNKFKQVFDVPDWIKSGSLNFKAAFVRALFDDEGSVSNSRIAINMAKQESLESGLRTFFNSIISILNDLRIRPGNVVVCARRQNKNGARAVGLLFVICGLVELKNFSENVGFVHPLKRERLQNLVTSFIQPNYHDGEARTIILDEIRGLMSTKEICEVIDRCMKTTRYHLKLLEKEGKIKKVVAHKSRWLWQLSDQSKERSTSLT
ncbi:MAG: hypothetical protein ABIA62_05610 [Candidatus Woesearchaeota archaeon]